MLQTVGDAPTCVTAGPSAGQLAMQPCDPHLWSDRQRWTLSTDGMLRSSHNSNLCLTSSTKARPDTRNWPLPQQFGQAAKFAHLNGVNGVFLNLDDLPLGATLRGGVGGFECGGTVRPCIYTPEEQRAIFTLYAVVRSQIMFDGLLPTDPDTRQLVTNRKVLEINANTTGNREFSNRVDPTGCTGLSAGKTAPSDYGCSEVIWVANGTLSAQGTTFVAVFWTGSGSHTVQVPKAALGAHHMARRAMDIWRDTPVDIGTDSSWGVQVQEHGVVLFAVKDE